MVDVEFIKKKHGIDGWSIRKIARQLQVSRQTVRKVLAAPAEPPRYRLRASRPRPVTGPFLPVIEQILEADRKAPPKQRHTARRVYERLVDEHGFTGSEVTVRRAVRTLRGSRVEVFVPLEAVPGKVAQVDFGIASVMMAGDMVKVFLFCLRAKHSRVPFVRAYPTEKLEAFLDGHVHAFDFMGGVFAELWYDNPKTAVVKVLAGPERIEHQELSRLRAHYLFSSSFCTPGEAHEKGSVEQLVGYVRRSALVPASRPFASFHDLNDHLLRFCEHERLRHGCAWKTEAAALKPLPAGTFRASTSRPVFVSKTALCRLDHNRYSVPAAYAGQVLRAELYAHTVEIYAGERLVARHTRSYQRGMSFFDLGHYLPVFAHKPRAAASCAALAQADPVFTRARDLLLAEPGGYRVFAEILMLGIHHDLPVLAEAIRECLAAGQVSVEAVRQRCLNLTHEAVRPIDLPELLSVPLTPPDLARYDALLAVAR